MFQRIFVPHGSFKIFFNLFSIWSIIKALLTNNELIYELLNLDRKYFNNLVNWFLLFNSSTPLDEETI